MGASSGASWSQAARDVRRAVDEQERGALALDPVRHLHRTHLHARHGGATYCGQQRGSEEVEDVIEALAQHLRRQRVGAEQAAEERRVAEVGEQCAVAGDQQLPGIVAPERARVHLLLQEPDGLVEQRPQGHRQVEALQVGAAVEGLPAHEPHVARVLLEEAEAGGQHDDSTFSHPSWESRAMAPTRPAQSVRSCSKTLAVQGLLRREVVQQARSADADPFGDVVERGAVVALLGEAFDGLAEDRVTRGRRTRSGGFRWHDRPR